MVYVNTGIPKDFYFYNVGGLLRNRIKIHIYIKIEEAETETHQVLIPSLCQT